MSDALKRKLQQILIMKLKTLLHLSAFLFSSLSAFAENEICPIMIEDEIDTEEAVKFEGKTVYLCCGKCVKIWNSNPKYFIKTSLNLLPQFKGMEEKLKLNEVKLMPQKFCPVYKDRIVTPDSPSMEIQGKKVYVWSTSSIRRWNRSPEESLTEALEAGLLPQFPKNKKIKGKTNPVSEKKK